MITATTQDSLPCVAAGGRSRPLAELRPSPTGADWSRPAGLLVHPVMVASLGLLVLNDHVLKARFHNAATGKLSDVAGLVFFPVLVVGLIEVVVWALGRPGLGRRLDRRSLLLAAGLLTAIGFTGIQILEPMTELYRTVAGVLTGRPTQVVADVTDLFAVPACLVGWAVERKLSRRRR